MRYASLVRFQRQAPPVFLFQRTSPGNPQYYKFSLSSVLPSVQNPCLVCVFNVSYKKGAHFGLKIPRNEYVAVSDFRVPRQQVLMINRDVTAIKKLFQALFHDSAFLRGGFTLVFPTVSS